MRYRTATATVRAPITKATEFGTTIARLPIAVPYATHSVKPIWRTARYAIETSADERRSSMRRTWRVGERAISTPQLAAVNRHLVEGITDLASRRVVTRIGGPVASGFGRGVEVAVTFDEEKYQGVSVLLMASVLERFFALYTNLNSFSQLVARTRQGEGDLKKWPPRTGELSLL